DELCIKVFTDNLGKTSFTIKFAAMNKTSNKIAALGHIVAVVVDQKTEKPSPLPDEFIKVLNSL
ncbi:MAG: acyl-CoA thioesterase, partial [Desulfobacula sp.]|nr:acyl-CoA thioesterase [Desulfobacula sp.]